MKQHLVKLIVNGEPYKVTVKPNETLLEVLRNKLELTGTKYGCGRGTCGACTILMEGKPILACLTLAVAVNGKDILTIEGLAETDRLNLIQEKFIKHGAIQCGFCTPGMIMISKALLDEIPNPTEKEIIEYIKGVLCRCTGYVKIVEAILAASKGAGAGVNNE